MDLFGAEEDEESVFRSIRCCLLSPLCWRGVNFYLQAEQVSPLTFRLWRTMKNQFIILPTINKTRKTSDNTKIIVPNVDDTEEDEYPSTDSGRVIPSTRKSTTSNPTIPS